MIRRILRNRSAAIAVATLLGMGLLLAPISAAAAQGTSSAPHSSQAPATGPSEGFLQVLYPQNYCLDGTITTITVQKCNGDDAHQEWYRTYEEDTTGGYEYKNAYNGYCLDGTLADVYPDPTCNPGDLHQNFYPLDDTFVESLQDPGYCLDATLSAVTLQPCTSGDEHQLWEFEFGE